MHDKYILFVAYGVKATHTHRYLRKETMSFLFGAELEGDGICCVLYVLLARRSNSLFLPLGKGEEETL